MKNIFDKKLNKLFLVMAIFILSLSNFAFAGNEVNVDGGDVGFGGDKTVDWRSSAIWADYARGARVSLWDVESQSLRDYKNLMTFNSYDITDTRKSWTYEMAKDSRCLSDYTKPEIIALNGVIDDAIKSNYADMEFTLGRRLYEESIEFPELFARNGSGAERQKAIKEFYQNEENANKLKMALGITDEDAERWKEGKLCLLVEPLVVINVEETITYENGDVYISRVPWVLTCAEVGLLALNGEAAVGKRFSSSLLSASAYKALPYGVFKESEGLIKVIVAYTGDKNFTTACGTNGAEDFRKMVNVFGCFEISCVSGGTDIPIMFHPNLENCGIGGTSPEPAPNPKYTHWVNCTHIEESDEPKSDGTYWYTQSYVIGGQTFTYNFRKSADEELLHIPENGFAIPKTYPDNIGESLKKATVLNSDGTVQIEYSVPTYNKYNTKPDGSGTTYEIGDSIIVTEPTTLYCIWEDEGNEYEGQANGRELVLYEDELSYVYDYDDIGNDDTRKLQGRVDSGGGVINILFII